jgi:hypothetical protein
MNADRRRREGGDGALSEAERAELVRLRKENAELAMERDRRGPEDRARHPARGVLPRAGGQPGVVLQVVPW